MNLREQNLRDIVASKVKVSPELLEVEIFHTSDGHFKISVKYNGPNEIKIRKRIDRMFEPPWYRQISVKAWVFYFCLGMIVFNSAIKSWFCVMWIVIAYINIPKQCPDCGKHHL